MASASIGKMTNALVEVGMIIASVVIGVLALSLWFVVIMVGVNLIWWGIVHRKRLKAMVQVKLIRAIRTLGLAVSMMTLGHAIGYGLGRALGGVTGLT